MTELTLDYPPSVNHYWRRVGAKTLISRNGRQYCERVAWQVHAAGTKKLAGRLSVSIDVHPPDNRRRDLDNVLKALLDACTKAGLWLDDSQIDQLVLVRMPVVKDGKVVLTIREAH
jgi:crossover junction endodeoxyribonuclease RusA